MFAEEQYVESSNLLSALYDAEEMKLSTIMQRLLPLKG